MKKQAHLIKKIKRTFCNNLWCIYNKVHCPTRIQLDNDIVFIGVIHQGIYAVVEFASRESVASLVEEAAIPAVSHESVVPFKSRLLSLSNLGSARSPNQQSVKQCQPQTTIPINELIQRLSREESVSGIS